MAAQAHSYSVHILALVANRELVCSDPKLRGVTRLANRVGRVVPWRTGDAD